MSDATQTAGSVANEAGLSFEKYAASVGKISEMTRLEGSTIGNAYKTIMARISRSKSADSDVSDADRSNAAKALASVNISTYDNKGNFKDLEEILDELSGKWNNLTDAQRNYISEQAAGVRNINTFKALMSTWGESKELAQSALDDTNFIDEVQDKYMDSVEGKLNHAKANIQDFFNTIISAGNIGTVVTGFNGITGALNAMIKTAQKLPGIGNTTAKVMTGFIGIASSGLLNSLTKANNELKQDDDLKGKYGIFDVFKKAGSTFKADFKTLGTKENAEGRENGLFSIFKNAFKDYKANASEAVQANNQLGNSLSGLNNNWNATKSAVSATWKSMTGFSKVLTGIGAAMLVWELGSKAFDLMTTSAKEAEEAVGKASTTYKNQTSTLKKNKDAVVSIQDEWSNLSKGVNTNTNENISLTSSEYERYLELNKQIASIIPETISGYDAQGNAILNLKGNVASLNAELEKQEASQAYKRIQDNAKAYQKNSQHVNGTSGWWNEFATYLSQGWDGIKKGSGYYYDEIYGNQKAYNLLKELSTYTTKDDFDKVKKLFENGVDGNFTEAYDSKKYLQGMFGNIQSYEDWQKVLKSGDLQTGMAKQQQAIKATAETNKQLLNDYITTLTKGDGEFSKLSDDVSNNIATLLTKTNAKTINKLAAEDNGLQNYALKYFNKIGKSKKAQDALSNLLGIGGETDIKKIQSILENDLDTLSNTLGIDKDKLEIQLDLKGANDAVKAVENVYDNAKKFEKTQKKSEKSSKKELTAKKRLGKYIKDNALHTADQLELLNQCVQNAQSLDEAFRQYETQKYKVEVDMTSLDDLKANLTTVKDEIDAINQAKTNSNSASGMTLDDIQKVKDAYSSLEGYDYSKLFEQTYSGMHLNAQELSKLQSQYEKTEYGKYTDKVTNLQKQYQGLCAAISRTSDASEKYNLIKQRDDISEQINQAKEYQSVFEGMTNSVTKWQNAQSYSLTQDIGSGYEDAKKLFDEGWIGDEKFQAYAQLFTNKDLSGSTSDVYEQVFAQNEGRMQRYFAEGRQGVNNFIQDIAKTVPEAKGLIDEAGNVDWTKMPSVKTLAKAMDLDKSLVDAMFKEMNRAGADLDFSEEADNLREMRDAAVQAGQSFNSLDKLDPDKKLINSDKLSQEQKDFKFDLNATGDSLDDQIESARKLRKALVEAYHEGSDQVKAFDTQLDYLEAKRGAETEQLTQDTREDAQNAINKELNRKQKKQGIKKKDRTQMDVDWDSVDASYYQSQADKLLDAISDKEGNIKIKLSDDGGKQALALLNEIQQKEWELSDSNVKVHVDTSQLNKNQQNIVEGFGNIQEAANNLQNLQNNKKRGLPVTKKAIQDAQTEVQKQINDFVAKQPNAAKNLNLSKINGDLGSKKLSKQQKQALQKEINKYAKNVTSGTAGDYLSKMEIKKSAWQDTKKSKKKDKNTTVLTQEVKVKGKDKVDKLKKEINSIKNTDVNLNVKDSRDKDSTKTESKKSSKKETQTKAETQARTKKAEKVVSAYNDFDDLKLSEKQQNVVVKYIADHSDIDKYTPEEKQAIAEYLAGHTDVDSWTPAQKEAVANFIAHHESVDAWTPAEKQALARYLLNSEQPDNYKPGGKDAVVTYSKNSAAVDTYNPPNIVRSVTYTIKTIGSAIAGLFGGHKLNGTAHVNGTAYANGTTGNWGAKQTETALVGEENPELRVDSRTGRWELLGQNGAEFRKINKGDIIFNARQTKDLFEHGYVNGRGKAFLNGTISRAASLFKTSGQAYGNGTWGGGRWNIYTGASSRKPIISTASNVQQAKQAAKQSAAAAASDADKFLETMDWIEIKIKRLEDVISDLDAKASSAYRKFSDRNKTLGDEFTKVTEEIQLQKDAYNAYLQKANSIDLAEDYKNKVRNGMLSIEDITDETLKDKIDEFQNWYEKCKECEYALQDLEDKLGDIVKTKFDNINDEFSSQLEIIEHENKLLETQLGIIEGKGMFAGQNYFTSMMKNQEAYVEKLHDQYMSLSEAMYDALDSGKVQEGSSAYYEMIKEINGVSEAWYEAKKQLVDYKNEAYEMDWSIFEKGMEYFSDITDESEFLQNILRVGDNDIFVKETGRFNDKGNAINSLHAMNYGTYMAEADKYKEKVAELNAEIEKDPSNTKLIDKRNEYIKQQREMIHNANGEKKSIHDLVEESYNKMLDILQKLIDKRKDFLQNEKDLYQYSKDIEEQVKSITDIKKQLNALGGDDSEETQSKVQSLKDQLKKAETDLEGSEYDQYITDQEKLLDNLYTQYEEVLNTRLDNIDGLLTDAINHGNENAENVRQTITEASEKVGYDVSEGFNRIWNSTDNGVGRILSEYSTNFLSSMSTITEYLLYIFHKMGGRTKEEAEQDRLKAEAEKKRQEELRRQQEEAKKQQQAQQQQQSQKNNISQDTIAGIAAAIWCEGNSGWGNDPFRSGKLTEKIGAENARKVQDYINAHGYNGDLYRYWINNLGGNASRFHYSAFKTGGYTGNNEGFAMLHAKERVLNATQTKAFETLVNDFLPDVSKELEKLRAFSLDGVTNKSMNSNISNDISLNLSLPNVSNANDFVKAIQTNRTLQQVIKAITIDEAMGKNTLSKFKY